MSITSKLKHKNSSQGLDCGHPPPPLGNVKIKAKKSALNNFNTGWTPPFDNVQLWADFLGGSLPLHLKVFKNYTNLVLKTLLLVKYQKLLTFLVKNPPPKISYFSWCFHMESPLYEHNQKVRKKTVACHNL